MRAEEYKQAAASAAVRCVRADCRLGVGTGSTVAHFIVALAESRVRLGCAVASSEVTARQLEQYGIRTTTLDAAGGVDLYVDGADEIDGNLQLLKGGGGAHTREKIIACCARQFVVIADAGKRVARLGEFPLAVEVIPMARGAVARQLAAMGGNVAWREGAVTDNGNWLLDVRELDLTAAAEMERRVNAIVGVVENGIFAVRRADLAFVAGADGVDEIAPPAPTAA